MSFRDEAESASNISANISGLALEKANPVDGEGWSSLIQRKILI
jgi:hypothetical protein